MVQPGKNIHNTPHEYEAVESPAEFQALLEELNRHSEISFDTETTSLDANDAELVGLSFCVEKNRGWYVPVRPGDREATLQVLSNFSSLFSDPSKTWIGHNLKYDLLILKWYGVTVKGKLFATLLAHYLIDPDGKRANKSQAGKHFENIFDQPPIFSLGDAF